MPVRNDAGTLTQQLDSLAAQDHQGDWDLVVCDDGSRDGSRLIAERWIAEHGLGRLVASSGRGPGAARNTGAAATTSELLAFCDADDVADTGWLTALIAAAVDGDVVAGAYRGDLLNPVTVQGWHDLLVPGEPHLGFLPVAHGGSCAVWRDAFDALGGFPEESPCGEDVAFSWRAQLRGMTLVPAPHAVMNKRHRPGYWPTFRRFVAYGMGDAWLYREFAADGMPRRSRGEALALWGETLRGMPSLRGRQERSGRWALILGLGIGRLVGSARHRTLYP